MIRGIGTSKGIGIGKAVVISSPDVKIPQNKVDDIEKEKQRFCIAVETFINDTNKIISELKQRLGNNNALIMQNQIYLVKDDELKKHIYSYIENEKICVEMAVDKTCDMFCTIFSSSDNEVVNQRAVDIRDLKYRLISILLGIKTIDVANLPPNTIIVADELTPSMTAEMDVEHVAGIVAKKGGETSHAAILARALEIPAVLSITDNRKDIQDGDFIIVDGEYGEVFVNPIERTIKIYKKKKQRFIEREKELKKYLNRDTITKDGIRVCLAANIGNVKDATKAIENGAEGIGLFRTEFLFMDGVSMPTQDEQFNVYKKAAIICKDKILTIRTLDIGGDKDVPYMGLSRESNPFLGYRAIRYCLGRTDVFTNQLKAILKASAFGNIRIMIPLVTGINELRSTKRIIKEIMNEFDKKNIAYDKNIQIGVMIETPAACVIAEMLAKEADFFSIGTNDLTQYTLAVDRGNENVAYLYSAFHPAVLRLIKNVIKCAKDNNIEVGMCGEAAANELMIPLLLAFGLDEFSVTASKVLEVKKNIASWTLKEAVDIAENVMEMVNEQEITGYIADYAAEKKDDISKKKEMES